MNQKNKISIYGASGHAKVIIDCIQSNPCWELAYLFDDNPNLENLQNRKIFQPEVTKMQAFPLLIGIGENLVRKKIAKKLDTLIAQALIHTRAIISPTCLIGKGSVVMPGAIINADTEVGEHSIINSGAIVEHDCYLDNFVHISPQAALAGDVYVGEGSHIGIGAQVIQGVKIGKWCTIGAGAVIIKDVPDGATVVGNPGRIIKVKHSS